MAAVVGRSPRMGHNRHDRRSEYARHPTLSTRSVSLFKTARRLLPGPREDHMSRMLGLFLTVALIAISTLGCSGTNYTR